MLQLLRFVGSIVGRCCAAAALSVGLLFWVGQLLVECSIMDYSMLLGVHKQKLSADDEAVRMSIHMSTHMLL